MENNNPMVEALEQPEPVRMDIPEQELQQIEPQDPQSWFNERAKSCPITPLGEGMNGAYHFMSSTGKHRVMRARDLNDAGIDDLLGGDVRWAEQFFPVFKKGECVLRAYKHKEVRQFLMQACARKPAFDENMPVRSLGVWQPGRMTSLDDDGRETVNSAIVHCGDKVWLNDRWRKAGFIMDGSIYPRMAPISRMTPRRDQASRSNGVQLLNALYTWHWANEYGPMVMMGLIGQALVCGALDWKAHGIIVGEGGTGKTSLCEFIRDVLGDSAQPDMNNASEAGLRQSFTDQARAILLDEMESDGVGSRVQAVIEMLRQMSSGKGATVVRGSKGGAAQQFRLNGCAMMFCISPPALKAQDRGRIVQLDLKKIIKGDYAAVLKMRKTLKGLSAAFRGRAVYGLPRYRTTYQIYRNALNDMGVEPRIVDQMSTVLAGADLLLLDDVPSEIQVKQNIDHIQPLLQETIENVTDGNVGKECLNHLLTSAIDRYSGGSRVRVNELVLNAIEGNCSPSVTDYKDLARTGIRIDKDKASGNPCMLVANQHQGLASIFAGSRWSKEAGGWSTALSSLDSAEKIGTKKFMGVPQKCVKIPMQHLPSEGRDDE